MNAQRWGAVGCSVWLGALLALALLFHATSDSGLRSRASCARAFLIHARYFCGMFLLEARYLGSVIPLKLRYVRIKAFYFFFVLLGGRPRREVGDDVVDVFDASHDGVRCDVVNASNEN
jgi:hypothetical protein